MSKSQFICSRCENAVHLWKSPGIWKHSLGGRSQGRSCGRPPIVVERSVYEASIAATLDALRNRIDVRPAPARGAGLEPATSDSKGRRSAN